MRNLIKRWERDIVGLRRMAKDCGRNEDWIGAHDAEVTAQTMETVVREAKATLTPDVLVVPPHLERLANPPAVAIDRDWDGDEGREGRRELTEDEG